MISGELIQVFGDMQRAGAFRLQCPTEGCCSVPFEWIMLDGATELQPPGPIGPPLELEAASLG
jgi:hypothetical protein